MRLIAVERPHEQEAGAAAEHGLDGRAPARLLGGDVDEIGHEWQLLGVHAGGRSGDAHVIQVLEDPAGAARSAPPRPPEIYAW